GLLYGDIGPDLVQHNRIASDKPCKREPEWELDSIHVTIIGVIDLSRNAADRRAAVAQLPQQQPGLSVEVQTYEKAAWSRSLHDIHRVTLAQRDVLLKRSLAGWSRKIRNRGCCAAFYLRKDLLDLSRYRQLRIETRPV